MFKASKRMNKPWALWLNKIKFYEKSWQTDYGLLFVTYSNGENHRFDTTRPWINWH